MSQELWMSLSPQDVYLSAVVTRFKLLREQGVSGAAIVTRQRTIPRDQRSCRVHPWRSLPASFQWRMQETCPGAERGGHDYTEEFELA